MSVKELKDFLQDHEVTASGYLKSALIQIASSVQKLYLPKQKHPDKDESSPVVINDVTIQDPYTLEVKNDFSNSPPFGLYDIFNFLI